MNEDLTAYVRAVAPMVGLEIDPYEAGVVSQFQRLQALAALILACPLPEDCPPAYAFDPES